MTYGHREGFRTGPYQRHVQHISMEERITIAEAIRRGYVFGKVGYNRKEKRMAIAHLSIIRRLGGGLQSVSVLEQIREEHQRSLLERKLYSRVKLSGRQT